MSKAKTIIVTQCGSPIRRDSKQRDILKGLGLGKMHRTKELLDTQAIRGMIAKVRHMVKVEEVS